MQPSYWSKVLNQRVGRRRALAATSATAAGAALLAACGGDNEGSGGGDKSSLVTERVDTTKQAKRGGIMKDRTFSDVPSLDIFTASSPHNGVGPHAYSSLVQFKPGYLKPSEREVAADLVESWEWSPDGLQITMKLRQGVKWHNKPPVNGRALDIDDVLFAWNRFASKSSGRAAVANVADPSAPVLSLTATDSKTIVIKLVEPVVYALALFTSSSSGGIVIVPKETDTTFDIRTDMIGTGPWLMKNYTPSVAFTLQRHLDYWDKDYALVDQIELPIIPEYSAALAQLKAGSIYSMGSYSSTPKVRAEDVLPVKRDVPLISVYQDPLARTGGISGFRVGYGWLPIGKSPFRDERVRQAISLAWDRDLYIDAFYGVDKFGAEGLPVVTRWTSALDPTDQGWWLDPKGKDFGPNAKYFRQDIAEGKKLLAAAGYPDGFETTSNYITGPQLGSQFNHSEVLDGMARELGITIKVQSIDYATQYIPLYRDGKGQFEGWAYVSSAGGGGGGDPVASLGNEYWSKGNSNAYRGFDVAGKGDRSGDPVVDAIIEKARVEQDTEKRRALVFDIQRYLAKPWYTIPNPGLATGFLMAWPCIGNFQLYEGARLNYRLWVDDTKPPFKSA